MMAKKKTPEIKAEAKAVAKVEASVKASYQRKKTITEVVPEDVTRAKAASWLDLISPITEWAGLKGDALKYQRQQLRIQQEETLLLVAQSVRRKIATHQIIQSVPLKILISSLESASLEDAADETMIEMWANLLSSASAGQKVEPRYVGIIRELSSDQAKSLTALASNRVDEIETPYSAFMFGRHEVTERDLRGELNRLIDPYQVSPITDGKIKELESKLHDWAKDFSGPGIHLEYFSFNNLEYNMKVGEGLEIPEKDFSILESLGLIKRTEFLFDYETEGWSRAAFGSYCYFTGLGIDFVSVCDPELVERMRDREAARKH